MSRKHVWYIYKRCLSSALLYIAGLINWVEEIRYLCRNALSPTAQSYTVRAYWLILFCRSRSVEIKIRIRAVCVGSQKYGGLPDAQKYPVCVVDSDKNID